MSLLLRATVMILAIASFSTAALADGWRDGRGYGHGHGYSRDYGYGYRYYDNRYYAGYYPAWRPIVPVPVIYSPPVVRYVEPAPIYVNQSAPVVIQQSQPYCREVQTIANINGSFRRIYGTACMQPDGSWQNVER